MRSTQTEAMKPKVLVLGSDSRMTLPIARSLSRQGIRVEVGWCHHDEPARWSRCVSRFRELPGTDQPAWRDALLALIEAEDYQLVIPATEEAVFLLQSHREEFERRGRIYLIPNEAFTVCFDKRKTYELAKSLGIPVPASIHVTGGKRGQTRHEEIPLPAIVKPCSSVRESAPSTKNLVCRVETVGEMQAYVDFLAARGTDAIVQEYFEGRGVGVDLLADSGQVVFAFQHARLHESLGYGSSYRKSVRLDRDLLDAASRLMKALHYTGVAMVEFRVDPASGEWRLIEINARFWGSLPLSVASGADFPYYLYLLLTENQASFSPDYRVGVHCRSFTDDLVWWRKSSRRETPRLEPDDVGSLGWSVNQVSRKQRAGHFLRGICCLDHVDTFAFRDPLPWFAEVFGLGRRLLNSILHSRRSTGRIAVARAVGDCTDA